METDNKPFLTEEDTERQYPYITVYEDTLDGKHNFHQQLRRAGFNAAAEKANARISELQSKVDQLEKELKQEKDFTELSITKERSMWIEKVSHLKSKTDQLEKERDEFLCISEPMPLPDAIKHLLTATNILLHRKDYDGPDYEEMEYAIMIGKKFLEQFKASRK